MSRLHIPSLYFTKGGSANSWCVNTDTELQVLNAGIAAHAPDEDHDATDTTSEEPVESTSESSISESSHRVMPKIFSIGVPQDFPRVYHNCTCICHDSPDHGHGHHDHEGAAAAPHVVASSSRAPIARSFTLVDVPNDETLFVSPRRAPVPKRAMSPVSPVVRTPSLATRTSSDSTRESSESLPTSRNSFLRSWSERCSSGWWRTSIASSRSNASASTTASITVPRISKPLPARPKRPSTLIIPSPFGPPTPRRAGFHTLHSSTSLATTPSDERPSVMFNPPRLSVPSAIYYSRPGSSQIGVAI